MYDFGFILLTATVNMKGFTDIIQFKLNEN